MVSSIVVNLPYEKNVDKYYRIELNWIFVVIFTDFSSSNNNSKKCETIYGIIYEHMLTQNNTKNKAKFLIKQLFSYIKYIRDVLISTKQVCELKEIQMK